MSRRLSLGLLLGALALLALYLGSRLEPYQESLDRGPTGEARRNPYLAAELFLRQADIQVERIGSLGNPAGLPTRGRTLLLLGDRSGLSPGQSQHLLDWAAAGGHLVFVAERLWDEARGRSGDHLLDGLGLQQYEADNRDPQGSDPHAETASREQDRQLTRLYLQDRSAPAYLAFDTGFHLYDASNRAHAWANSGAATHMLQLRHGAGLVTALTDACIWENDRIGEYDHAWLLGYLTQDSQVTLAYRSDPPGLLDALRQHFPEALLALALLLLFGLWHLSRRQGPLLAPPERGHRQLQAQLHASAAFARRHDGEHALLARLQDDIHHRAARLHPGYERLIAAERLHALAQLSRLPADVVQQAMHLGEARHCSAVEFTRQVTDLQRLRNAL